MKKSITFKTAFVIVLSLHIVGFFCLTSYFNHKSRIAKHLRDQKKEILLKTASGSSASEWPQHKQRPAVVASAPIKPIQIKQPIEKPKKISTNISDSFGMSLSQKNVTKPQTKAISNKQKTPISKNNDLYAEQHTVTVPQPNVSRSIPVPLIKSSRFNGSSEIVSRKVVGSYIIIK